jgi:hypothetical protein
MDRQIALKWRWRAGISLLISAAVLYVAGIPCVKGADAKPEKEAKPAKAEKKSKKLTGADLYAMHCNRCHPERYATERTAAQWKTIMLHMRIRANLPAEQAKTILKYLQEDSGK